MIKADRGFLLAVFFLLGLGLVQIYSSSYIFATESYGDGLYFFKKQLLYAGLGLLGLLFLSFVPWKIARLLAFTLWAVGLCLLVLTYIPSLGVKVGGATRWVSLPFGLRFEPAELMKVTYPAILAWMVTSGNSFAGKWTFWVKIFIFCIPLVLFLGQPDFGSFVLVCAFTTLVLFAYGLKWRYIFVAFAMAVPAFYVLVVQVPYRWARIAAFLDPWADPQQKGYQVIQSMLSLYSGGLWGQGLGQGQGKLFFLPEAHTDFTLAVFGEEWGFAGIAFLFAIYGFLVFRGIQISLYSKVPFNRAMALGLTAIFGLSVFINCGVVIGLLPTKGLTMPFLSYGGSSLLCTCLAMGWLINLDRQNHQKPKVRASKRYKAMSLQY